MAAMCASLVAAPAAAAVAKVQPSKAGLARLAAPNAATFSQKTVSNGMKTRQMLVWTPLDNKFFETFSYLPPLSNDAIAKQVDYIVNNGFVPCLEFAQAEQGYISNENCVRLTNGASAGYYDNRYWTMYKLPMFGCSDASQVLKEISNCEKSFPNAYIRLVAFDQVRQVQCTGFLVHRPPGVNDYRSPDERSI